MSSTATSQVRGGPGAPRTAPDKRATLIELAARVTDGDTVAIGGGLSSREPMAVIREMVRQKKRGLNVIGSAHGIDIDMMAGAGMVAKTSESYVGFEQDFGIAPNYRRGCESGEIVVNDGCCYTVTQQIRAAVMGIPFIPIRSVRGTGFPALHPEYKSITCPFTGEELLLVPAIVPDVAIIHAQYGDISGNLRIEGPPVMDKLFAKASRVVVASVEKIVPTEELLERGGITIPYFYVDAVAEVAMGAHPTSCYPFYAYDRPHTAQYIDAARAGADVFASDYIRPFIENCPDHEAYLEKIGGQQTSDRLASWNRDNETWMRMYAKESSR